MDYIENAKLALENAKRELWEAEESGDHEAVLIWRRTVAECVDGVADALFMSGY